jgi:hypothetical protein
MPISGNRVESFKWFYRPESNSAPSPIVVVTSDPLHEVPRSEIPGVLAEIDSRHWSLILQLLLEAKMQAEVSLRNDEVIKSPTLAAHYLGWLAYSDFIISSLESLRNGQNRQE